MYEYEDLISKNRQFVFFHLCIQINLNQTVVGLFWSTKKYS